MSIAETIAVTLLDGGSIFIGGKSGNRLRDYNGNPVVKVSAGYMNRMRRQGILMRAESGLYFINFAELKNLHGNCRLKKVFEVRHNNEKNNL
jgi:hypothetical protein